MTRQHSIQKITEHPILMRWHEPTNPLPTCEIRAISGKRAGSAFVGRPWVESGVAGEPFDFCVGMRRLLVDITTRSADFQHIQVPRILLTVTQARSDYMHGLQARVTPLRFPQGALTRVRRGVAYQIQRYFLGEQEFLYVLTFCLPRYLNQSYDQKFITLFHELYHMHPEFNGDLRRHEGRYQLHTRRQRDYNRDMAHHARAYLAGAPDRKLSDFLRMDFAQLQARHAAVTGIVVPRPKIVPVTRHYAAAAKITPTPPNP